MELFKSILTLGYILYISGLVKAGCKNMDFKESFDNKALQGHVFKTEWASSDGHCESKCFLDDRCIAYSFGQAANGKKYMCELSDSDHVMHPSDLVEREGTIYRRAQNNCNCESFQVCRVNFVDNTHRCECKPRYTGSRCDVAIKPCDSSPCQYGGNCVDNLNLYTFTCKCPSGFTGNVCEIHDCNSNPCLNGGTCEPQPGGGYKCSCNNANGVDCETRIKPCKSSPCKNGGICVDDLNLYTFTCQCLSDYTGNVCEIQINDCNSGPCLNGGCCIRQPGGGYTCSCVKAFGVHCQTGYLKWTSKKEWFHANNDCKNQGRTLPSIHSAAENSELKGIVKHRMWIGINRNSEGKFAWSDGTEVDYNNWLPGWPDPGHDCSFMVPSGTWYSDHCDNQYEYICVLKQNTIMK